MTVASLSDEGSLAKNITTIHVSLQEDNAGALILAETLPPQNSPHTKHYALKTIWFCEDKVRRELVRIKTVKQLVDMLTKALLRVTFGYLRSKLMGW